MSEDKEESCWDCIHWFKHRNTNPKKKPFGHCQFVLPPWAYFGSRVDPKTGKSFISDDTQALACAHFEPNAISDHAWSVLKAIRGRLDELNRRREAICKKYDLHPEDSEQKE